MAGTPGGPKILKLESSWHKRRRSKILAVRPKHWKGRRGGGSRGLGGEGGGVQGAVPPPPPGVYGHSNTPLRTHSLVTSDHASVLNTLPPSRNTHTALDRYPYPLTTHSLPPILLTSHNRGLQTTRRFRNSGTGCGRCGRVVVGGADSARLPLWRRQSPCAMTRVLTYHVGGLRKGHVMHHCAELLCTDRYVCAEVHRIKEGTWMVTAVLTSQCSGSSANASVSLGEHQHQLKIYRNPLRLACAHPPFA